MIYTYKLSDDVLSRKITFSNGKEYCSAISASNISDTTQLSNNDDYFRRWLQCKKKPSGKTTHGEIRVVDLFCGCGGLSLGIEEACRALEYKITPVLGADMATATLDLYQKNFSPHLLELQQELLKLANAKQNYDAFADEIDELRAEKEELLLQEANKDGIRQRMADMVDFLQSESEEVTEYSESLVRRMIEKITVYDDHFVVEFKSRIEITINE